MLAFLAQHRLPLISCVTNYVPKPEASCGGISAHPSWPCPRTRDMELPCPAALAMLRLL